MRRWLLLVVPVLAVALLLLLWNEGARGPRATDSREIPAAAPAPPRVEEPVAPPPPVPAARPVEGSSPATQPSGSDVMILRVLGPSGEVVEDASVRVELWLLMGRTDGGTARRREDGSWEVVRGSARGLDGLVRGAVDDRTVAVESPRFGRLEVAFEPGLRDVRFEGAATVRIALEAFPKGGPPIRARLCHPGNFDTRPFAGPPDVLGVAVDAGGRVALGPVQPGSWELILWLADIQVAYGVWPLGRIPLELAEGDREIVLPMPPLHELRVSGAERWTREQGSPGPAQRLSLQPATRRFNHGEWFEAAGADGIVTFPLVPPGDYRVAFNDGQTDIYRHMIVTVPTKGVVPFVPSQFNALLVTVEDPTGYWTSCGLRSGELILAFDGTRIEPTAEADSIVPRLHVADDHRIVLRIREPSGRERDVEVLYHRFFGEKGSGGRLEPVFR